MLSKICIGCPKRQYKIVSKYFHFLLIWPTEEDTPANSVKGEMTMNMECDSIFKHYSPAISTPLNSNLAKNINSLSDISIINPILQPILKQDATSQVDYVTSNNSTPKLIISRNTRSYNAVQKQNQSQLKQVR